MATTGAATAIRTDEDLDLSSVFAKAVLLDDQVDFVTAQLIVDCHCDLGEGIVYDDQNHALLWTDINLKKFHKLQLNYDSHHVTFSTYNLPKMLGSFGMLQQQPPASSSSQLPLLCAWEDGFQLYDMETQQPFSEMSQGEPVNPRQLPTRLNDGRVAPEGKRFICGGHNGGVQDAVMKVFKCEQQDGGKLVHTAIVDEIRTTNSISWSGDGNTMYLADSPTRQIHKYQYDATTGTLSNKNLVYEMKEELYSVPDGSCVDAEGYLWNAVWRKGHAPGMVQRIDPTTGQVVFTVHMPDETSQVTCCCFGGENMDILFMTTAAEDRKPELEPHAGGVYAAKLRFKGRKEARLQFTF